MAQQLLNIKSDYVFKRVFGVEENKNVLTSFLNAVLQGQPHIQSIELINSEIPKFGDDGKSIRLDIQAQVNRAEYVDIEIQCYATPDLKDRVVYYLAHMLVDHRHRRARDSYSSTKVIGVWVLGENCTELSTPVNRAKMYFGPDEQQQYHLLTDLAQVVFVELPKFHREDPHLPDGIKAWLTFLTDPENPDIRQIHEIQQAYNTLELVSGDPETRTMAEMRERAELDARSAYNAGVQLALQKAEARHTEEMKEAEQAHQAELKASKRQVVISLAEAQFDAETIAKLTSIPLEEVLSLLEHR